MAWKLIYNKNISIEFELQMKKQQHENGSLFYFET